MTPGLYVLERKTTSEDLDFGSVFWRRLLFDSQPSTYVRAARELGHDVQGVLYDVLKKPTLRLKKGETPEAFRDRIIAEQYTKEPERFFARKEVVRLDHELDLADAETWAYAEQIHEARKRGRWPRNVDACFSYNSACEYLPICTGEEDERSPRYRVSPREPRVRLSKSSLQVFRQCQAKYRFAHEVGIRPIVKSSALRMGTAMHDALEVWSKYGHDVERARAVLTHVEDREEWAKLDAMMVAYHCMWEAAPMEETAVEAAFDMPLVNPETGQTARTFYRTGRIDALVRVKG